jgi:transcriptional regulator with XRE-family HTH domain
MEEVDVARAVAAQFIEIWDARGGTERGFQNAFATTIKVNQGTVSGWIASMRHGEPPKIESLAKLCQGLGVPIASLFPGSELGAVERRIVALLAPLDEVQKRALADELAELVKAYRPGGAVDADAKQILRQKQKPRG